MFYKALLISPSSDRVFSLHSHIVHLCINQHCCAGIRIRTPNWTGFQLSQDETVPSTLATLVIYFCTESCRRRRLSWLRRASLLFFLFSAMKLSRSIELVRDLNSCLLITKAMMMTTTTYLSTIPSLTRHRPLPIHESLGCLRCTQDFKDWGPETFSLGLPNVDCFVMGGWWWHHRVHPTQFGASLVQVHSHPTFLCGLRRLCKQNSLPDYHSLMKWLFGRAG
jgi:hypothetical protein